MIPTRDRRRYIQIATTLGYSTEIIKALHNVVTVGEANRLMMKGREVL